jgi:hypothetical protein
VNLLFQLMEQARQLTLQTPKEKNFWPSGFSSQSTPSWRCAEKRGEPTKERALAATLNAQVKTKNLPKVRIRLWLGFGIIGLRRRRSQTDSRRLGLGLCVTPERACLKPGREQRHGDIGKRLENLAGLALNRQGPRRTGLLLALRRKLSQQLWCVSGVSAFLISGHFSQQN